MRDSVQEKMLPPFLREMESRARQGGNSVRSSNEDRVGWTSPALNVNVDDVWKGFGEICSDHRKTKWPIGSGEIWEVDSCSRTSG